MGFSSPVSVSTHYTVKDIHGECFDFYDDRKYLVTSSVKEVCPTWKCWRKNINDFYCRNSCLSSTAD